MSCWLKLAFLVFVMLCLLVAMFLVCYCFLMMVMEFLDHTRPEYVPMAVIIEQHQNRIREQVRAIEAG